MKYRINVAERYGRNWNDTEDAYKFLFRIEDDCPSRIRKVVNKIQEVYSAPEYNVTFYKTFEYSNETNSDFKE